MVPVIWHTGKNYIDNHRVTEVQWTESKNESENAESVKIQGRKIKITSLMVDTDITLFAMAAL